MKKVFLVLLVLAFIACTETKNNLVEEHDEVDEFLDEVVLQFKFRWPKIDFGKLIKKLGITKLVKLFKDKKLFRINFRRLRLNLKKMKLPKIKIGPKTQALIDKIAKGAGKGIAKLKELGIWEPLISLAKNYGLEKAAEICLKNLEDEDQCKQIIGSLTQVADQITGTGDQEGEE